MTLGKYGAKEYTTFDPTLANSTYYVGKDREDGLYKSKTLSSVHERADPDAGLIGLGSRSNHDNLGNRPYSRRQQVKVYDYPDHPHGYPQGYSAALSGANVAKAPLAFDKAREGYSFHFGAGSPPPPPSDDNPFASRIFKRTPPAGRPGIPAGLLSDGDSYFRSRA